VPAEGCRRYFITIHLQNQSERGVPASGCRRYFITIHLQNQSERGVMPSGLPKVLRYKPISTSSSRLLTRAMCAQVLVRCV
jgi:hypothetical protein